MNYDTMSVDELLGEYAKWANERITTHWEHQIDLDVIAPDQDLTLIGPKGDIIESALRKAVVREASIGNVVISTDDIRETHFAAYSRDCGLIGDCGVADGDYDLIPHKETPTVNVPEDTEGYVKIVKMMVYWKGRYEMAVRGMTDKAAIEIMGEAP